MSNSEEILTQIIREKLSSGDIPNGSQLGGFKDELSKIHKELKRPIKQINKALGIKTPSALKKAESQIKSLGRKADKNKEKIIGAAVAVVALYFGGPIVFSAIAKGGQWAFSSIGNMFGAKSAAGQISQQQANTIAAQPTSVNDIDQSESFVKSQTFVERMRQESYTEFQKQTGIDPRDPRVSQLLDKAISDEQEKILKALEKEKSAAIKNKGVVPDGYDGAEGSPMDILIPVGLAGVVLFLIMGS